LNHLNTVGLIFRENDIRKSKEKIKNHRELSLGMLLRTAKVSNSVAIRKKTTNKIK
jgi:hypothetical protein